MKILEKLNSIKFFIIFLIIGLGLFSYPMIISGFDKVSGDLGDTRLVTYIMEHYFYWFKNIYPHQNLWNMPFLYPYENTLAFTDVFLGLAIFYVPIRFFIENPFSVIQISLIIVGFLNYFGFYILLKNKFKFNDLSSSCGAYLFAFSILRFVQVNHFQLQLQFYTIFGIYFLLSVNKENTKFKIFLNYLISAFFFALQFWTAFYLGYFVLIAVLGGLIIGLSCKNSRDFIIFNIKNHYKEIVLYCLSFIIFVLPLFIHYFAVGQMGFAIQESLALKATLKHWFMNISFIDNTILPFTKAINIEKSLNIGIFASIISILGLCQFKNYKKQLLSFIFGIIMFFSITPLFIIMHKTLIGFSALRASARVAFLILPFLAIGFGKFLNSSKNLITLVLVVSLMLLEQIPIENQFKLSKKEHKARIEQYTVNPACKIINLYYLEKIPVYDVNYELDGMWLALNNRKYTFNGYTGYIPRLRPYYEFIPKNCVIFAK